MRLTACLIVKNEEKNLPVCLKSMQAVVDEIIVVDTGSTDNTKKIAISFGAKIVDFPWNDSFADAKNAAIKEASGDWIIFLDADEYLNTGSERKLDEHINNINSDIEAIMCSMVHRDNDRGIVTGENTILRIFRNIEGLRYIGDIHEEPRNVDKPLKALLTDEIIIIHTGYSSSVLKTKFSRNLQMLLKKHNKGSADAMTYYYISGCEAGLSNFQEAIKYAHIALEREKEIGEEINPSIRYQLYTILLRSMLSLENEYSLNEVQEVLQRAIVEYPKHPEIVRYQGVILMKEKKLRLALKSLLYAIELDKEHNTLEHNDFSTYKADTLSAIGSIYSYMNKEEKSMEYYSLALRENKYYDSTLTRVLRLLSKESPEEIINFLQNIYDKNSQKDIEFLVKSLGIVKLGIPLVYYTKILNEKYESEDYSVLEAMLALGKYVDVAETALSLSEQSHQSSLLPIACAAILLGELGEELINRVKKISKDAYYSLILLKKSDSNFIVGNKINEFILNTVVLIEAYSDTEIIHDYLHRALPLLDEQTAFVIIDKLISFGNLDMAQVYYELLAENAYNYEIKRNSFFISGFCAYRIRRYEEAVNLFERAVNAGYHEYEITECLQILSEQYGDSLVKEKVITLISDLSNNKANVKKLHIGCGRDVKAGWINLDLVPGKGVDIVADLDDVKENPLPLNENSVDFILASHVIEHIRNPLGMMEELYRVAKPYSQAHFRCPYGSSDDAFEDPTHVKQYFLNSFQYFSQPLYWRADYGYRGDWKVDKVVLYVEADKVIEMDRNEVMDLINTKRNIVREMRVDISAVKPIRAADRNLMDNPGIELCLI